MLVEDLNRIGLTIIGDAFPGGFLRGEKNDLIDGELIFLKDLMKLWPTIPVAPTTAILIMAFSFLSKDVFRLTLCGGLVNETQGLVCVIIKPLFEGRIYAKTKFKGHLGLSGGLYILGWDLCGHKIRLGFFSAHDSGRDSS